MRSIAALGRTLGLVAAVLLAACSADPKSLGITGPGIQQVPQPPVDTGNGYSAGVPQTGTYYGPTTAPMTGASGFWGYN